MSALRLFRQDDFSGGLNLRADQFQLRRNESPHLLNVEIDPRGGVFSRGAMRNINTVPIIPNFLLLEDGNYAFTEASDYILLNGNVDWNPKALFHWDGPTDFLMFTTGKATNNGKVFSSTGGNFTDISVPITNPYGATFAPWGEKLFISTGRTSQSYQWSGVGGGVSITASGTATWGTASDHMPKANVIASHAGKVFVANTEEDGVAKPNRLRWSDENSPLRWTFANYIDVNEGGSEIVAIIPFNQQLLIFKQSSVFLLTGFTDADFEVVELTRKVGAVNQHAVAASERAVYFFSYPAGLFAYAGGRIVDLSEPIRPMLNSGDLNQSATNSIFVNFLNRRVWLSLPYKDAYSTGKPRAIFVYDPTLSRNGGGESFGVDDAFTENGCWTLFETADGYGICGGTTYRNDTGTVFHAVAHPVSECVASADVYLQYKDNFGGGDLSFDSYYRTRWIDGDNYAQKKMFRRPEFVLKQVPLATDITVKVYHNYEEADGSEKRVFDIALSASGSGMVWGVGMWGSASWGAANEGAQLKTGSNMGLARSVQMEISGTDGKPWGIDSFIIKYNPRRVKA